jgi:hypothetical protein
MANKKIQEWLFGGTKVFYYYVEHREDKKRIARFSTVQECDNFKSKLDNPKEWKVTTGIVVIRNY